MKIVALCKTFAGEEWIEAMTLSIYRYVDKIVFVNSEVSWTGAKGNTCKLVINNMKTGIMRGRKSRNFIEEKIDKEDKIISLNYDTIDQNRQCQLGYKYIQKHVPCDYVMLIDTDEVWDDYDMQQAILFIKTHPEHLAYRTAIYTYIKSPYWRVDPIEPLRPVSFIRADLKDMGNSARACNLSNVVMQDKDGKHVFYHHFVYVRDTFNKVLEKIISSHVSENTRYMDMSLWIPRVWNLLPRVFVKNGFHPAIGYQENWQNIEVVKKEQLPRILRERLFSIMETLYIEQ